MMTESNLSLEEIRARRKALAEEDRILQEIERDMLALEKRWADYRRRAAGTSKKDETPISTPVAKFESLPIPPRKRTKNALIIEALNAPRPLWQSAKDIQAFMTAESGSEVPMSSVSPALTALKNSETIVRKDMLVALALRVEQEEPSFLKENGEASASPDADQDPTPDQISQPSHGGA